MDWAGTAAVPLASRPAAADQLHPLRQSNQPQPGARARGRASEGIGDPDEQSLAARSRHSHLDGGAGRMLAGVGQALLHDVEAVAADLAGHLGQIRLDVETDVLSGLPRLRDQYRHLLDSRLGWGWGGTGVPQGAEHQA